MFFVRDFETESNVARLDDVIFKNEVLHNLPLQMKFLQNQHTPSPPKCHFGAIHGAPKSRLVPRCQYRIRGAVGYGLSTIPVGRSVVYLTLYRLCSGFTQCVRSSGYSHGEIP